MECQPNNNEKFDFCFLFSNPLINDINKISFDFLINHDEELNNIIKIIEKSHKKINASINVLNIDNFKFYLSKEITLLHLSCHGSIDLIKGKKVFNIYFDNNGKVEKISIKKLKKIIEGIKECKIHTLILSLCHSEEISQIFIEKGVKNIICIEKHCGISEKYMNEFEKIFYEEIFIKNQKIKEAFEFSINNVKLKLNCDYNEMNYCCCFHPHKENCEFKKKYFLKNKNIPIECLELEDEEVCSENDIFMEEYIWNDHDFIHNKQCDCFYKEYNIHQKNCDFLKNFLQNRREFKCISNQKDTLKICCCNHEFIHNESSKIKLFQSDSSQNNHYLFEKGFIKLYNSNYLFIKPDFYGDANIYQLIQGRKIAIYSIINRIMNLSQKEIINIYGDNSLLISKFIAKYCYDRGALFTIKIISKDQSIQSFPNNKKASKLLIISIDSLITCSITEQTVILIPSLSKIEEIDNSNLCKSKTYFPIQTI